MEKEIKIGDEAVRKFADAAEELSTLVALLSIDPRTQHALSVTLREFLHWMYSADHPKVTDMMIEEMQKGMASSTGGVTKPQKFDA